MLLTPHHRPGRALRRTSRTTPTTRTTPTGRTVGARGTAAGRGPVAASSRRPEGPAVTTGSGRATAGPGARRLRLDMLVGRDGLRLLVAGELDLDGARRLDRAMTLLERSPRPSDVDLTGVTFADSSGLAPLVESTRRRRDHDLPPLCVHEMSPAVTRVLTALGVAAGPRLDVEAWDAAGTAGLGLTGRGPDRAL